MLVQVSDDARVTLEITQNLAANSSTVRLTRVEIRQSEGRNWGSCWLIGEIQIGGNVAATLVLNSTKGCAMIYSGDWDGGGESDWTGYTCQTLEIPHLADGTKEVSVDIAVRIFTHSENFVTHFNRSVTISLPRVPRATELSATAVELGQQMRIALTRAVDSFRDSVRWSCGVASGIVAENTGLTELTWTPPLALAGLQPEAETVTIELTAETYADEERVGTSTLTLICPIPASVRPEVTLSVTDRRGYAETHGGYIQDQSQASVQADCLGSYGSTIHQVELHCGNLTATGTSAAFTLPRSGQVEITAQVTDSRGRTNSDSCTITVLDYHSPRAQMLSAWRCDETGQAQDDGMYLCLRFRGEVAEIENSQPSYRAVCQVHGGSQVTEVALTEFDGAFVAEGQVIIGADVDNAYDCILLAQDSFTETQSAIAPVGVAFALMDFCRDSKGVGIGMRAKLERTLCIGLDTDMQEHRICNLLEPVSPMDGATKAYVDEKFRELAAQIAALTEGAEQ